MSAIVTIPCQTVIPPGSLCFRSANRHNRGTRSFCRPAGVRLRGCEDTEVSYLANNERQLAIERVASSGDCTRPRHALSHRLYASMKYRSGNVETLPLLLCPLAFGIFQHAQQSTVELSW